MFCNERIIQKFFVDIHIHEEYEEYNIYWLDIRMNGSQNKSNRNLFCMVLLTDVFRFSIVLVFLICGSLKRFLQL